LQPFLSLLDLELDFIAFVEVTKTRALNCREVDEDILAAALCSIKPKPLSALNHFTLPVAIIVSLLLNLRSSIQFAGFFTRVAKKPIDLFGTSLLYRLNHAYASIFGHGILDPKCHASDITLRL
jgi:hypothetical protein